jgi:hypothetical protein
MAHCCSARTAPILSLVACTTAFFLMAAAPSASAQDVRDVSITEDAGYHDAADADASDIAYADSNDVADRAGGGGENISDGGEDDEASGDGDATPSESDVDERATDLPGTMVDSEGAEGSGMASSPLALPPLPPEPSPNPAVVETTVPITQPVEHGDRPEVVVKTIIGLVALLALAYVGGHPRIRAWESAIGVSEVITAGFPFVALGVAAKLPAVGVLTEPVLAALGPLLRLGLGWIGLIIGFRFDARVIESVPRGIASFVGWRGIVGFASIVGACSLVLLGADSLETSPLRDPVFLRDALILGTAGSVTSLAAPRLLQGRGADRESVSLVAHVVLLEELVGILGLLAIAAYFRPQGGDVTWQLPGTAWLLLTLGAGIAIGILVYAILLRTTTTASESLVLILGSVAFAAGLASNLRLSPVVVCFVAGLLLKNFPGQYKERLAQTLATLERPIYLVFLLVVGALWKVGDWRGWLLMVVFVAARLGGKWLGTLVGVTAEGLAVKSHARRSLAVAPLGALSIAIVVNAEILYPGGSISWIVTAIVGGSVVTEVLFQLTIRDAPPPDRDATGGQVPTLTAGPEA